MQFDQSENLLTDGMQANLHLRSRNLNILWNILEMEGQIKSKRYGVQLCQTLSGHMVAGDVEFVMRDRLNKLKSKSAMIVRLAQTIYSKYYILLYIVLWHFTLTDR